MSIHSWFWSLVLMSMASQASIFDYKDYLATLGYGRKVIGWDKDWIPEEVNEAYVKFQKFNGLQRTGLLDDTTERTLNMPRCGMKDYEKKKDKIDPKWPTNNVTWNIVLYDKRSAVSPALFRTVMKRAFDQWAEVVPFQFQETQGKADIEIFFVKFKYARGRPFDGPKGFKGRIYAYASPPPLGKVYIDAYQRWELKTKYGMLNLQPVATHVVGHALGLKHSPNKRSVMSPKSQNTRLDAEDIEKIQSLYGSKKREKTTGREMTDMFIKFIMMLFKNNQTMPKEI